MVWTESGVADGLIRRDDEFEERMAMADRLNNILIKTKRRATGLVVADVTVVLVGLSLLFAAPVYGDIAEVTRELDKIEDIVFAVRQLKGPHWYENMGHSFAQITPDADVPDAQRQASDLSYQRRFELFSTELGGKVENEA